MMRGSIAEIWRRQRARLQSARMRQLVEEGVLSVGAGTYGSPLVRVWRNDDGAALGGRVVIGAYCSIADNVEVFTGGGHRTDWISTYPFRISMSLPGSFDDGHPTSKGDVLIGADVWLASGVKILSGVTIGPGAVVGAGAVVASSVRPYAVVSGNPAVERSNRRFDDETIARLLELAWWDWPEAKVRGAVDLLSAAPNDRVLSQLERLANS